VKSKLFNQLGWIVAVIILIVTVYLWLTPYFKGLLEINPVMLKIGGLTVYWYGLLLATGILSGLIWLNWKVSDNKLKPHIINIAALSIAGGVIGARLAFVILKWSEFSGNWIEMISLRHGGMSIHGALILGALTVLIYAKIYKLPTLKIFDFLVPAVLIGQIIGRFGNFFNQEAFGPPTDLPWKMFVKLSSRPAGFSEFEFFHPTFLYSAIGLIVIFLIIMFWQKLRTIEGSTLFVYIALYAVLRFMIEFFRIDSDYWLSLTLAQWASLIIILSLIISLVLRYRIKTK